MRRQYLWNTAEVFSAYIYASNRRVVPVSASLTVYAPGGASKVMDGAAMTIGADGLLTCPLSGADNGTLGQDYMAVVTYVHDSTTASATFFYDVVRMRLTQVVTDEDLTAELPQLKESGWRVSGTADSGSSTVINDAELRRYPDGFFTGGTAYSIDKDETREVVDFASSTGTATTTAFSSAIAQGERYTLTRSFTSEIRRAFDRIEERLLKTGRRPELALDPYDFRETHIFLSVAQACKGLASQGSGFWWDMWREYERRAEAELESVVLKYDSTGDGVISSGETGYTVRSTGKAVRG